MSNQIATVSESQPSDLALLATESYWKSMVQQRRDTIRTRSNRLLPKNHNIVRNIISVTGFCTLILCATITLMFVGYFASESEAGAGAPPLWQILAAFGSAAATVGGWTLCSWPGEELFDRLYPSHETISHYLAPVAYVQQETTASAIVVSIVSNRGQIVRKQRIPLENETLAHETIVAWEEEILSYQQQAEAWMPEYQQQLVAQAEADEEASQIQQRLAQTVTDSNRRLTSGV